MGREPVFRQSLALGGGAVRERGFQITDACMGCGSCQRSCPQKCIEAGEPFLIRQEACLRCGRCFELCPVSAIERR
ncbi:4Fe-4S binding protein [uncultured Olsenella sp.]|uniref:indolepyruvate ferredoxin oxidoreductase subunit alpha n=1 Tax=uncultured Olsenella sp. TaxID=190764 RepID=UPI0026DB1948|nr:4Fe-4S binding protein [uncultured Olsenella sp.]